MVVDGALAVATAVLVFGSVAGGVAQAYLAEEGDVRLDGAGVALLAAGTLPLVWRRRAAVPVLAISGIAFFGYQALGYAVPALPLAPLVALYTVAVLVPLPASMGAAAALVIGIVTAAVTGNSPLTEDPTLDQVISVIATWMLGYAVQLARTRTALAEEHAARLAAQQAARTQLAIEQEHARIAVELHDIVAHDVCVIVAQAAAARLVFDAETERARETLGSIETTGRAALAEMRLLLGVLRTEGGGRADRAPQPGLDQLPALADQVERAGLPVRVSVRGEPRPLPAGVELSAYRIIREALTNSLKHAGPARADVVLGYHTDYLDVRVSDDGRGDARDIVPGQGLVGMWQRAAVLGGELTVGSGPAGGFHVTARLPVRGGRS